MPLNRGDADFRASGHNASLPAAVESGWWAPLSNFRTRGALCASAATRRMNSATIIILPVIRIERYADPRAEEAEPQTHPPADNGGRRRLRRR